MTEQTKVAIAFVLIVGLGVAGLGYLGYLYPPEPVVVHKIIMVVDPNYVQCPAEAQERLKAQGLYDGRIDGIWGEKTDRSYCDWCAIRSIEGR